MNLEKIKRDIQYPLVVFIVSRTVFFIPALISLSLLESYRSDPLERIQVYHDENTHFRVLTNLVLKWDAQWFMNVAKEGYYWRETISQESGIGTLKTTNVVFFPLLPILIRTLSVGVIDLPLTGILVCNIAFLGGLIFLYIYLKMYLELDTAQRVIIYFAFYPTAFIYSSIYSESLFILFSVLTFYFMEKQKYLYAGLCAMLLTASRFPGIIIIPAILAWIFMEYKKNKVISKDIFIPLIIAPVGILFFFLWIWHVSGRGDGYFIAQALWNKSSDFPWNFIKRVGVWFLNQGLNFQKIRPDAFFVFPILIFTLWKFWKLPLHLSTFWLCGLILALSVYSVVGFPRYTGVLFPMYIPLAQLGRNKWVHWLIFGIFLIVGNFSVIGWTNWYLSY